MKIISKRVLRENSQSGFSLLESMVAAMISLIFISLGANLVLAANIQKAMAKKNTIMNNFVQSNLDEIKYQASLLTQDPTKCNVTVAADSYAAALMTQIGATSTPATTTVKVLNRNYTMTRTTNISTTDNRLMTVAYEFKQTTAAGSPTLPSEYNLYTEIMPASAFNCPAP